MARYGPNLQTSKLCSNSQHKDITASRFKIEIRGKLQINVYVASEWKVSEYRVLKTWRWVLRFQVSLILNIDCEFKSVSPTLKNAMADKMNANVGEVVGKNASCRSSAKNWFKHVTCSEARLQNCEHFILLLYRLLRKEVKENWLVFVFFSR